MDEIDVVWEFWNRAATHVLADELPETWRDMSGETQDKFLLDNVCNFLHPDIDVYNLRILIDGIAEDLYSAMYREEIFGNLYKDGESFEYETFV